mmetsp:Transcript_8151/g.14779  ORF Transcript_8151/g.14779 Transcript_8151/m.14779 type:complete len:238 (-) Transcript_8151:26-739(-)
MYITESNEIIKTCLEMNASGINQGTSGNISLRVEGGFLITPSGIPYEKLTSDSIVFVDLSEKESGYRGNYLPSSEWRMHRDIYLNFSDAQSVVHTHSRYATGLACTGKGIPAFHYMVGVAGGNTIPCAKYGTFGSQELSDNIVDALSANATTACLMENHGTIVYGCNLQKALSVAKEVENLAHQYNIAISFGEPKILSDSEMRIILAKFKTYGKQTDEIKCMCSFDQEHAIVPPLKR